MTNHFASNGDLWIEVESPAEANIPAELFSTVAHSRRVHPELSVLEVVREFNLTGYIRHMTQPARPVVDWHNVMVTTYTQHAYTAQNSEIVIVGNSPNANRMVMP